MKFHLLHYEIPQLQSHYFTPTINYIKLKSFSPLLQAFGSILEHLDFAHNKISHLPVEFYHSLTNLKTFDLSGNHFVEFDVSFLHHVSELKIEDSPFLKSLEYSQHHLTNFQTFSAKNSTRLKEFCPWIIWSSPLLHKLNLGKKIFSN